MAPPLQKSMFWGQLFPADRTDGPFFGPSLWPWQNCWANCQPLSCEAIASSWGITTSSWLQMSGKTTRSPMLLLIPPLLTTMLEQHPTVLVSKLRRPLCSLLISRTSNCHEVSNTNFHYPLF